MAARKKYSRRGAASIARVESGGRMTTSILSYGMGVESTALLLRWVLEPETRHPPCDLGRKVAAFENIYAVRVARSPCVWGWDPALSPGGVPA